MNRLIDADSLKDKLVALKDYKQICEIINNSPTVEVNSSVHWIIANKERPQDEWITYKTPNDDIWQIECNKCHYTKGSKWVMFNALPPYCEKCGTKMKEVQNERQDFRR